MKSFKIKNYGCPHLQRVIQTKLFSMGYFWMGKGKSMRFDGLFNFCYSDGIITQTTQIETFNESYFPEVTINELMEMKSESATEEMTLEQVCKVLGKNIKIIK